MTYNWAGFAGEIERRLNDGKLDVEQLGLHLLQVGQVGGGRDGVVGVDLVLLVGILKRYYVCICKRQLWQE